MTSRFLSNVYTPLCFTDFRPTYISNSEINNQNPKKKCDDISINEMDSTWMQNVTPEIIDQKTQIHLDCTRTFIDEFISRANPSPRV
jgi:hypothetical protein